MTDIVERLLNPEGLMSLQVVADMEEAANYIEKLEEEIEDLKKDILTLKEEIDFLCFTPNEELE